MFPCNFLYTAVGTPGTWNVSWPNKNYRVSIVVLLELVFAIIIQAGGESPRLNTVCGTIMQCMYD